MAERRRWAVGSNQYVKRLRGDGTPAPAASLSATSRASDAERREQLDLTGVTFDLDAVDLDSIQATDVERARHRFRAAMPDLIWNAAALEGNTFTLPEVRTLLDGTTVHGKPIEDEQQVIALSEGYSLVDDLVGSSDFRLDKSTTDRIHALIARHEAAESGHFRGEGVVTGGGNVRLSTGGVVAGVPTDELAARWERLLEYLETVDDPRARALIYNAAATRAQLYFDGNKRTARLMMTGELMRHGFDAVNVPRARLLEYNVALDRLFQSSDATELLQFLASCAAASPTR